MGVALFFYFAQSLRMPDPSVPKEESGLIRAIGVPGLTANIVNSTVGAGIFALPALVAAQIGAASPLAYVICAGAMCLFVSSFAMAGSRVSLTGGLYAYVEVAFGRYFGFLAGPSIFSPPSSPFPRLWGLSPLPWRD